MCGRIRGIVYGCVLATLVLPALGLATAFKRPETQRSRLHDLSRRLAEKWERGRDARYTRFLRSTDPAQRARLKDPNLQLMYIDDRDQPVFYRFNDLISAKTVSTDEVWPGGAAGFALDGNRAGHAYLAQWDAGAVEPTHQEFGSRVIAIEPAAPHFHATRVAGIMVAAGVSPAAIGMSPAAELYAFTSAGDDAEMALWATQGLHVSNHSYSALAGWDSAGANWFWYGDSTVSNNEDVAFGRYTANARDWDEIAYSAPYYTIVGGVGNDRGDGPSTGTPHFHGLAGPFTDSHAVDGGATGFDTVPGGKTGKNMITVGGVQGIPGGWTASSGVQTTTFSGWGPTDDWRVKPDVVAQATSLFMPDTGSGANNYAIGGGCSFAGPAVAGSVNLMLQHWNDTHGGIEPLSSTVKAIVIHTASEAGATGPDFVYGWGLLDARAAVELIDEDRGVFQERIIEATLTQAATDTVEFHWGDEAPFSVSMAWTDPPGEVTVPLILDELTPKLVNDLDLRVRHIASGTTYEPWVLTPSNPPSAATRGDNFRDNVEQVRVDAPPQGWYRALITHKGVLDSLEQTYSLILPARRKVCLTPVAVMPPTWGSGPAVFQHLAAMNEDSRPDLVLTDPFVGFRALASQSDGSFSRLDVGPAGSLGEVAASVWEDLDNDGDSDAIVGLLDQGTRILRHDGSTISLRADSICEQPNAPPGCDTLMVIAPLDANADGRIDVLVAGTDGVPRLRMNQGGLVFGSVSPPGLVNAGLARQIACANLDTDAEPEIFIANSDGPNKLFDATGSGYVEIPIPPTGGMSFDAVWGYLDDNAIPDLFVANRGEPDQLLLGTPGGFVLANLPQSDPDNGTLPGVTMADVDLDGDVDVLLTHRGRILLNNGLGVFTPGPSVPSAGLLSASLVDLSRDGFPDVLLAGPEGGLMIHNDACAPGLRWLELDLQGHDSPRSGLGAIITVSAGPMTQRRQVGTGAGARSRGPHRQHFGLGGATSVNVRVDWPSGRVTQLAGVPSDQVIKVIEPATVAVDGASATAPAGPALLAWSNPMRSAATLEFRTPAATAVTLEVLSVDGRLVRRWVDARREAGAHRVVWDGRDDRGHAVPNGVYFGLLRTGDGRATARIVVAR